MPQRFDTDECGVATPLRNPIDSIRQMAQRAPLRRLRSRAAPQNQDVTAAPVAVAAAAAPDPPPSST